MISPPQSQSQWKHQLIRTCQNGSLSDFQTLLLNPQFRPFVSPDFFSLFALRTVCQHGRLDILRCLTLTSILQNSGLAPLNLHAYDHSAFFWACISGHLEIVKFLTTSSELLDAGFTLIDPTCHDQRALILSSQHGHLDLVRFFLTHSSFVSPSLRFNLHTQDDAAFRAACSNGHLPILQFLTTSEDLLSLGYTPPNFNTLHPSSFLDACEHGHLQTVRYLLDSCHFLTLDHAHLDAPTILSLGFQSACRNHHEALVRWFIFDHRIPMDHTLHPLCLEHPFVAALFEARDQCDIFSSTLSPSLDSKPIARL